MCKLIKFTGVLCLKKRGESSKREGPQPDAAALQSTKSVWTSITQRPSSCSSIVSKSRIDLVSPGVRFFFFKVQGSGLEFRVEG